MGQDFAVSWIKVATLCLDFLFADGQRAGSAAVDWHPEAIGLCRQAVPMVVETACAQERGFYSGLKMGPSVATLHHATHPALAFRHAKHVS